MVTNLDEHKAVFLSVLLLFYTTETVLKCRSDHINSQFRSLQCIPVSFRIEARAPVSPALVLCLTTLDTRTSCVRPTEHAICTCLCLLLYLKQDLLCKSVWHLSFPLGPAQMLPSKPCLRGWNTPSLILLLFILAGTSPTHYRPRS